MGKPALPPNQPDSRFCHELLLSLLPSELVQGDTVQRVTASDIW
jgi:hypothetical protein